MRIPAPGRAYDAEIVLHIKFSPAPVICFGAEGPPRNQKDRFLGVSYRTANWTRVGQTAGGGKMDRYKQCALPIKDVYLYPLTPDFRSILTAPF